MIYIFLLLSRVFWQASGKGMRSSRYKTAMWWDCRLARFVIS